MNSAGVSMRSCGKRNSPLRRSRTFWVTNVAADPATASSTKWAAASRGKINLQRFRGREPLQAPAVTFEAPPGPAFRRRSAGDNQWKLEPEHTRRGLAWAGVAAVLHWQIELPTVRCGLSDHHGERRFAEMHEGRAVASRGDEDLADDFRGLVAGVPHRLSLAHGPAWPGELHLGQRGKVAAAGGEDHQAHKKWQQEDER